MRKLKFLILALLVISCSDKTIVVKNWEDHKGIQRVPYFICKHTTPFYKFGSKEYKYEFYGDDAETKAYTKCNEIK